MRPLICIVAVFTAWFTVSAWAQTNGGVTIRSNSLQMEEETGDISFSGEVEVRVRDVVFTCDFLTVQADGSDSSQVRSGEATGNVVFIRDSDRVEAQKAIFDLVLGSVELSGAPRLIREDATIEAEKIIYNMEEGTATFNGPVKAVFRSTGD